MEGPEIKAAETVIDNGSFGTRTVRFETGRLAQQAQGAVAAYLDEETMLLSATSAGKHPREGFDFFPLTVDVEERAYAAGKIDRDRRDDRGDQRAADRAHPGRSAASGLSCGGEDHGSGPVRLNASLRARGSDSPLTRDPHDNADTLAGFGNDGELRPPLQRGRAVVEPHVIAVAVDETGVVPREGHFGARDLRSDVGDPRQRSVLVVHSEPRRSCAQPDDNK